MAQSSTFNLGERSRREGGGPPEQGGGIADRLTELEAEVGELERMLARSHRLVTLGTIVASIAHELNNILTPVMSYAELAQQHPDDAGLRDRAMSRIASGVSRASGITSAILAFAGARGAEGGDWHVMWARPWNRRCAAWRVTRPRMGSTCAWMYRVNSRPRWTRRRCRTSC